MLNTYNIAFGYSSTPTFHYPNLDCSMDKPLLITGKSGCGKTTLLHLLGCILKPKMGNILISNIETTNLTGRQLDKFRGQNIGIIFQKSHFMQALCVWDNILLSQYSSGKKLEKQKAKAIAKQLGIDHLLHKKTSQLSQGEQQRVTIARSLLNEPKLLLADEPTSSLDDDNCQQVIQLLKNQSQQTGAALAIVTHDERVKTHFTNTVHL